MKGLGGRVLKKAQNKVSSSSFLSSKMKVQVTPELSKEHKWQPPVSTWEHRVSLVLRLHRAWEQMKLRNPPTEIFSPCGRVVDVFIPSKKSKSFNTKFGFIRFKRREEVLRAINDLNGLLIRGFRMFVQFAKFSKSSSPFPKFFQKMRDGNHIVTSNDFRKPIVGMNTSKQNTSSFPSYAKIVKGVSDGNTKEVDGVAAESGWLQNSAVGKLINYCYVNTLQDLFISNGIWDAHIHPLGGLNVLMSFESVELLDNFLEDKDNVLPKWFSFVEAWKDQNFKPSRCVWISCYGVPLKAWCFSTFINIEDPLAETSWEKRVFTSIKIKKGDNLIGKDAVFEMVEVEHEDDVSCDLNVHGPLVEKICLSSQTKKNDMEFEPCNHSTDVGNHLSFSRDVDSFVGEPKFSPGNEAVAVGTQSKGYSIEDGVATTKACCENDKLRNAPKMA
ncbi:hypothetical protein Vadar_025379 [Vaccinium darrowii]|uniref:Uncharacterized protein n=1 Tax=Vaccinium darrowii TaxID=229202 RepID=A0ACB7Y1F4_9ERIC|nr:hypothetical protein Vadar_025379 [Vaccinium darrowii]